MAITVLRFAFLFFLPLRIRVHFNTFALRQTPELVAFGKAHKGYSRSVIFNHMQETIDDGMYSPTEAENLIKSSGNMFRSEHINFLPSNIELVRNKFVFKKLDYESIIEIAIRDGYLIKNRWIIRILSAFAIYLTVRFMLFNLAVSGGPDQWNLAQWFNKGSLISVWAPLLITLGALIAMYQSFIRSPVFKIRTNDAEHIVRIKTMEENKTLDELIIFLKGKRLLVSDNRKVKVVRD